jgi:hypothetical protein
MRVAVGFDAIWYGSKNHCRIGDYILEVNSMICEPTGSSFSFSVTGSPGSRTTCREVGSV